MDMGGMDMGGSASGSPGAACKISMLYNWYTVDSCFLAKSWHVHTLAQFAGSVIGVFFRTWRLQVIPVLTSYSGRFD
jgi:copper transporter 1